MTNEESGTEDVEKCLVGDNILSQSKFVDFSDQISDKTLKALEEMKFKRMTQIQAESIPHLLDGK